MRILLVKPVIPTDILTTFLERSQHHPLHIVLDCRPRGWQQRPLSHLDQLEISRRIEVIMDVLLTHVSHLRSLLVKVDFVEQLWPVIQRLKYASAPVLESLRVTVIRTEVVCGKLFLGGLPSLRSIKLGGIHRPWQSLLLHGLTSLDLSLRHRPCIISISELQGIFEASPRLETLSLYRVHVVLNPAAEPTIMRPSTMDSLTTLKLGATDTLPSLLNSISAPNLRKLHFSDLSHAQLTPSLEALCARAPVHLSFPDLQCLQVSGVDDPLFNPFPLLHVFPTVQQLTLQQLDIQKYALLLGNRDDLQQHVASGTKPLLPLLQTLTVDYVYATSQFALTDILFTLVMDRIDMGLPLKTFRTDYLGMCFDMTSPMFSYDVERFRDIVELTFYWCLLDGEWGDVQNALDDDFGADVVRSQQGGSDYYYYDAADWEYLESLREVGGRVIQSV
jgi:hypothetical protein